MAGMTRFDWADPFLLDEQLTDEERLIRDTARSYAQDRLAPRIVEAFQHEHTDVAIFREMGELGLLGPTVPEEYGGVGAILRRLRPRRARSGARSTRGIAR